ncbi:MAG: hypothetical protein WKG06_25860 [Segetibacter sp.]
MGRRYLAGFSDSALFTSPSPLIYDPGFINNNTYDKISYNVLNAVTIKRKGRVGRGILIGGLTGAGVGGLIGFASGNDPTQGCIDCFTAVEKAAALGVIFGVAGTAIGALAGALKQKNSKSNGKYQNLRK